MEPQHFSRCRLLRLSWDGYKWALRETESCCGDPVYGFECSSRTDLYLRRYRSGCKYHGKFVFQSGDCNRSVTIGKPQDRRPRLGPENESSAGGDRKSVRAARRRATLPSPDPLSLPSCLLVYHNLGADVRKYVGLFPQTRAAIVVGHEAQVIDIR